MYTLVYTYYVVTTAISIRYIILCTTINITRADGRAYQKPQVVVFTDFIIYCLLVNPTSYNSRRNDFTTVAFARSVNRTHNSVQSFWRQCYNSGPGLSPTRRERITTSYIIWTISDICIYMDFCTHIICPAIIMYVHVNSDSTFKRDFYRLSGRRPPRGRFLIGLF